MSMEIVTTITISDINAFCHDYEENIKRVLHNKFAGKCYMGEFIIEISEIKNISDCKVVDTNNSGDCIITVMFTANTRKFTIGEIIVGVTVVRNDTQFLHAVYRDMLHIAISSNITLPDGKKEHLLQFNSGDIINVVLTNVIHVPYNRANATAKLLLPNVDIPVVRLDVECVPTAYLVEEINAKIDELNFKPPDLVKFLREAYGVSDDDGDFDITDTLKPGTYTLSSDKMKLKNAPESSLIYDTKTGHNLLKFRMLNWLTALNEMATVYTKEVITANKKMFQILRLYTTVR